MQCTKVQHCTHTHDSHFGKTAGLPIPMQNPNGGTLEEGKKVEVVVLVVVVAAITLTWSCNGGMLEEGKEVVVVVVAIIVILL